MDDIWVVCFVFEEGCVTVTGIFYGAGVASVQYRSCVGYAVFAEISHVSLVIMLLEEVASVEVEERALVWPPADLWDIVRYIRSCLGRRQSCGIVIRVRFLGNDLLYLENRVPLHSC